MRPDASNTGYLALKRWDGDLVITTPGQIVEGLDVHGNVVIKAPNVICRKSIFRGGKPITSGQQGILSIVHAVATNYLVEDITIVPEFPNVRQDGIKVNQAGIFRRINLSGTADGMTIYGSGVKLYDSWLHDFVTYSSDPAQAGGPSHSDAIMVQAGSGVRISGNSISGANNAAVIVTQDAGVTSDLTIENNFIDGGAVSVNVTSGGPYKNLIRVQNNRFGRNQIKYPGGAIMHNSSYSDLVPVGNVYDDDGTPAKILKG